jgi:heptosyltransferase-2
MSLKLARILVRLPNWLGDALMARAALFALRAGQPEATITAVGPASLVALLAEDGVCDRLHAWPATPRERAALHGEVRGWSPQAALILPPSFSSAWWAWRCGAPIRVGYRGDARDVLLTHGQARPARGDRHLAVEYMELAAALGAVATAVPILPVAAAARTSADALRSSLGVTGDFAVLGPGALYGPAKRWSPDRFAAVGRSLVERGWSVVVSGVAGERQTCDDVAARIGAGGVSVAGMTDLPTQAALCANARIAVCNDSGLAHLAAAVGAPTIAIFGSTSSAWTAPRGARVHVVQRAPVCAPCFQRRCAIGYRCLERVDAASVLAAVRDLAA